MNKIKIKSVKEQLSISNQKKNYNINTIFKNFTSEQKEVLKYIIDKLEKISKKV